MSLWRLVIREIRYRRLNFAVAVLSVMAAAGCLVTTVTLLRGHDLRTRAILEAREAETADRVRERREEADRRADELNESFRKIMLKFGYNLLILPAGENVVDYQIQGAPSQEMDESAVRTLAESGIMTVRHLLPILQQKQVLVLGDRRQEVFLIGTRGEVPEGLRDPRQPIQPAVAPGGMILGHDVHRQLGADVGDKVKVVDADFTVSKVLDARGTSDDSSVWIDLAAAQRILGKPGKINGILALSCICTHAELQDIQKEIERILPGTQVRTMATSATIRYESRVRAAEEAEAQVTLAREQGAADMERERRARATLRGQIEALAAWVVPIVLVAAAAWMALLAFGNVRERTGEIGILRALGLRSRQIFAVFLARALAVGVAGACLGYGAGFLAASAWREAPPPADLFIPWLPAVVLLLAPALSVLAGWVPATIAAGRDPATILREQ